MKKPFFVSIAVVLTILLSIGVAFALTVNDGQKLNGPHYQFNIIGHPNSISGDNSNGNAVMVPLVTENNLIVEGYTPPECPNDYPDDPVVDEPSPDFFNRGGWLPRSAFLSRWLLAGDLEPS